MKRPASLGVAGRFCVAPSLTRLDPGCYRKIPREKTGTSFEGRVSGRSSTGGSSRRDPDGREVNRVATGENSPLQESENSTRWRVLLFLRATRRRTPRRAASRLLTTARPGCYYGCPGGKSGRFEGRAKGRSSTGGSSRRGFGGRKVIRAARAKIPPFGKEKILPFGASVFLSLETGQERGRRGRWLGYHTQLRFG
jgi:hypothetical protein